MATRLLAVAVAALGVGLPAAALAAGTTLHPVVSAKLRGGAEVPKGSPAGSGTAVVNLDTKRNKACWTLSVKRIDRALSAHIHKAPPGKAGPVVIPLGARFSTKGCVIAPRKAILAVARNPGAYYVNVHTKRYLDGAIRGQLHG
jgi:CHRD domain